MVLGREIAVHLAEGKNVIVRRVNRHLHSGDDNARGGICRFHFVDDGLQIIADLIDRGSAKRIVDSKLQNKDVDLAFEIRR